MDFNQYQQQALTTLNSKLSREQVIFMCVFGIIGETGEITDYLKKQMFHQVRPTKEILADSTVRVKMCDELGDLLWYIAVLSYEVNKRGQVDADPVPYDDIEDELLLLVARVGDLSQAIQTDGIKTEKDLHAIHDHLGAIMESIVDFSSLFDLNLYTIMHYNVAKLKARHSEGFTSQYTSDSTKQ